MALPPGTLVPVTVRLTEELNGWQTWTHISCLA